MMEQIIIKTDFSFFFRGRTDFSSCRRCPPGPGPQLSVKSQRSTERPRPVLYWAHVGLFPPPAHENKGEHDFAQQVLNSPHVRFHFFYENKRGKSPYCAFIKHAMVH